MPGQNLTVDVKGQVVLCCNDYQSTIRFGNLNSEKILDIWNKPHFKSIREELKIGNFQLDICKKCAAGKEGIDLQEAIS